MEEPIYNPSRPMPTITILYQYALTNCPGKTNVGLRVDFPPNGSTPPHRHNGASASAYVVSGTLLNKMNEEPMAVMKTGATWHEKPGCHHKISDNASESEPAVLIVSLVLDAEVLESEGMDAVIQIDEEYRA